jgi:hypothetical protein
MRAPAFTVSGSAITNRICPTKPLVILQICNNDGERRLHCSMTVLPTFLAILRRIRRVARTVVSRWGGRDYLMRSLNAAAYR